MAPSMFRAAEVMDMAVQIERQGVDFYKACLQSAADKRVKEVFKFLIDEEKRHIEIFSTMKEDMQQEPLPEEYPGEIRSYMEGFVKNEVFYPPKDAVQKASQMENPNRTVDFAVEFEKRSILFYSGLKQLVRRSEGARIDDVIAQEHGHIRRLLGLRRSFER